MSTVSSLLAKISSGHIKINITPTHLLGSPSLGVRKGRRKHIKARELKAGIPFSSVFPEQVSRKTQGKRGAR